MRAPAPPDASSRRDAIARFGLGAGAHERAFEGIVELAAQICECPVALVSIVHDDAQRFEARRGTDLTGTGLDAAICAHAILDPGLTEIPDTRADPRTRDNPMVRGAADPMLFYAGAPLVTAEGVALGTLCVLDRRPRRLSAAQRRALEVLAEQVVQRLELHAALNRQDILRREVDHRVKNSLANVAVLTRLSARDARSAETREALAEIERRITVMSELHRELYRLSADQAELDAHEYLGRIAGHLGRSAPPGVRLEAAIAPFRIDSRRASPLGVALNEMVGNAFRHGFPEGRRGGIWVTGRPAEGHRYRLAVRDDGAGASQAGAGGGLGLRILRASVEQLGGRFEAGALDRGFEARAEFPLGHAVHAIRAAE